MQGAALWLPVGESLCDLLGSAANTEIKESALDGPLKAGFGRRDEPIRLYPVCLSTGSLEPLSADIAA